MARPKKTKQSKFSSVIYRLKPGTPKKKLLLFVIIFALLAGGYYAYSTFAATAYSFRKYHFSSQRSSGYIDGYSVSKGSKRTTPIAYVAPLNSLRTESFGEVFGGTGITGFRVFSEKPTPAGVENSRADDIITLDNKLYAIRVCATVKNTGPIEGQLIMKFVYVDMYEEPLPNGNRYMATEESIQNISQREYSVVCTPWKQKKTNNIGLGNTNIMKGSMRISDISIQWK
jgi:hypothetical protein